METTSRLRQQRRKNDCDGDEGQKLSGCRVNLAAVVLAEKAVMDERRRQQGNREPRKCGGVAVEDASKTDERLT